MTSSNLNAFAILHFYVFCCDLMISSCYDALADVILFLLITIIDLRLIARTHTVTLIEPGYYTAYYTFFPIFVK